MPILDIISKLSSHSYNIYILHYYMIGHMAIQFVNNGDIKMTHISGILNEADGLTRALGWLLYHRHCVHMMGINSYVST